MAVLRFLGQSAFEITGVGGRRMYFDPWITGNPVCPVKLAEVSSADIVFTSHGHSDHIGDSIEIVQQTGAVLVSTPEIGMYAETRGIPYGGPNSYSVAPGGSARVRGIPLSATVAFHSSDIMLPAWPAGEKPYPGGGAAMGFVVEVEPGLRVYHAGDTALFGDMRLIAELYEPTVALLPIGGRYTMGPREAAIAAQWLKASVVIPMHYNTFADEQRADPDEFARLVAAKAPAAKVVILKPGESYKHLPE